MLSSSFGCIVESIGERERKGKKGSMSEDSKARRKKENRKKESCCKPMLWCLLRSDFFEEIIFAGAAAATGLMERSSSLTFTSNSTMGTERLAR